MTSDEPCKCCDSSVPHSHCTDCGCRMESLAAQFYERCRECAKTQRNIAVRTLDRRGTEEIGRSARNAKVLGGSAELGDDGDDYDPYGMMERD